MCAVAFRTTHGQNKTRKCDTEVFVPVASLCGVVGSQSQFLISLYNVVFDKSFSSTLSYTSRPYSEAMAMRLAVTYTLYATSLKEQTGDVITFAQFEEGNILTEARNDA